MFTMAGRLGRAGVTKKPKWKDLQTPRPIKENRKEA
jgi:hypothetical protein